MAGSTSVSSRESNPKDSFSDEDEIFHNSRLLRQMLGFQSQVQILIDKIREYKECKESVRDFNCSVKELNASLKK